MPVTRSIPVKDLVLDKKNFRTISQKSEKTAANALISLRPEWFWALMESLIENGYSPTENIIVLADDGQNVVKEGNRRVAALKLIHGLIKGIDLPSSTAEMIKKLPGEWYTANESVPCAVYSASESQAADEVVARTHGYNEKAGRLKWESIARVRHSRDFGKRPEPALDLLEAYIKHGKNATGNQKELWAGDYPISILEEAMKKLAPCVECKTVREVVDLYPKKYANQVDKILLAIGEETLGFKHLRSETEKWEERFGFKRPVADATTSTATGAQTSNGGSTAGSAASAGSTATTSGASSGRGAAVASPLNDPKSVIKRLKSFRVRGKGREKIELLRKEIVTLNIDKQPHSFCFLLRSMFELSAKAYCFDHKGSANPPKAKDNNGIDRKLVEVLRDITNHLTNNKQDKAAVQLLHGPMTELARSDGLLSVTSLNQLVHNQNFSISPKDICIMFFNVVTLLESMNGK